jgi:hypothetical protein
MVGAGSAAGSTAKGVCFAPGSIGKDSIPEMSSRLTGSGSRAARLGVLLLLAHSMLIFTAVQKPPAAGPPPALADERS